MQTQVVRTMHAKQVGSWSRVCSSIWSTAHLQDRARASMLSLCVLGQQAKGSHPRAEEAPKAPVQRRREQRDDDRCGDAAAHQNLQRHRGGRRFRVRRQIRVSDIHAGAG